MCRQFSLLQPAGTVTTNSGMHSYVMFRLFWENVVLIGHGSSFWLVLESHGKVVENDFAKRVVTLVTTTSTARLVLFSVMSVCVFVCLSVNMITPEPLETPYQNFQSIMLWLNGQTSLKME